MPLFLKVFLVPYPAIKDIIKSKVAQLLRVRSCFREFFIPYVLTRWTLLARFVVPDPV
jgi:hypothetical protein